MDRKKEQQRTPSPSEQTADNFPDGNTQGKKREQSDSEVVPTAFLSHDTLGGDNPVSSAQKPDISTKADKDGSTEGSGPTGESTLVEKTLQSDGCTASTSSAAGGKSSSPQETLSLASCNNVELLLKYYELLRRFHKLRSQQRKGGSCGNSQQADELFIRQESILEELRRKLFEFQITGTIRESPPTPQEQEDKEEQAPRGSASDEQQERLLLFLMDPPSFSSFSCGTFKMTAESTLSAAPQGSGDALNSAPVPGPSAAQDKKNESQHGPEMVEQTDEKNVGKDGDDDDDDDDDGCGDSRVRKSSSSSDAPKKKK